MEIRRQHSGRVIMDNLMKLVTTALEWSYAEGEKDASPKHLKAAAEHLTHRPLTAIILSVILGLTFTWGGLILAFVGTGNHLPVSFYISAMAALTYFVSMLIARFRSPRRYRALPHPNREHMPVHTHKRGKNGVFRHI